MKEETASNQSHLIVPDLIERRKQDGRAVYSVAGKAAVVRLVKSGVAKMPVIARANGLNHNLVGNWVKQAYGATWVKSVQSKIDLERTELVPIKIVAEPVRQKTDPLSLATRMTVQLARGTLCFESCSAETLKLLITQLSEVR